MEVRVIRIPDMLAAAPNRAGAYHIPVSIQGVACLTLVDSGCSQTSIHQGMSQGVASGTGRVVHGVSQIPAGKSSGHPTSSIAAPFSDRDPLQMNWNGSRWAIA